MGLPMMAKGIFSRLRDAAVQYGDPEREQRLDELAAQVEGELVQRRQEFSLNDCLDRMVVRKWERPLIVERVYEHGLRRAWADLRITDKEQKAIDWVAHALALPASKTDAIQQRIGLGVFEACLSKALEDSVIDEKEASSLEIIAGSLGTTTADLVRRCFDDHGQQFLKTAFSRLTTGGQLDKDGWDRLVESASRLGLERSDLQRILEPQSRLYIEKTLAGAKADDRLDDCERVVLEWLLEQMPLSESAQQYYRDELAQLEVLTQLSDGHLPVYEISGIESRSGEVCHYKGPCTYRWERLLSSGVQVDDFPGTAVITDLRLVFTSDKSFMLPHKRVLKLEDIHHGIQVTTSGRGAGSYWFGEDHKIATLTYRVAVKKANRTIVAKRDGLPSRHIPQEVKQRVYQRDGGKCVDCGADQYLEYDHIIPVAKGGNNFDKNIQLLCRACNLAKSDNI